MLCHNAAVRTDLLHMGPMVAAAGVVWDSIGTAKCPAAGAEGGAVSGGHVGEVACETGSKLLVGVRGGVSEVAGGVATRIRVEMAAG